MGKHHAHYAPGARGTLPARAWAVMAWGVLLVLWTGITVLVGAVVW